MENRYINEDYVRDIFGVNLAKCMRDRRFNQQMLAGLLKVNRAQVSRWLTGVAIPKPKMLAELCKVLNVSPGFLWTDHYSRDRAI